MKKRALHLIALAAAFFAMSASFLVNANLKRHYKPGDFVPEENAYFVEEIDDPVGLVKAHKFITPSDNKYTTQKNYSHSIIGDIENTWSAYTGKGTTVAIIDDGFDYNHPEYTRADGSHAILSTSRYYYASGNSAYYKEYSSDPTCIAEDWEETYEGSGKYEWATHGTNTSTTAAAPMGNGGGVGIAPEADILALKIDFSFVAIRAAIQYAVTQKVDVINMSLGAYAESFTDGWGDSQSGSSSTSTYLNNVCQTAYNNGIIVVAAAGNESTWHKSYPACNTKVIGVGALEENDANTLAAFTNYVGSSQSGEINVDILAPGYVYSATQSGKQNSITHIYDDTQGTSFSSPIVAGAACLWKQKNPNGTPDQFLTQLQSTAAGIGTYKNKMVPVSLWGDYSDVGPSNITCGRLDIGALMDISEPFVNVRTSNIYISVNESSQIQIDTHNGTLSYVSQSPSIATVSSTGLVKGIAQGNTTITVTATKNGHTATASIAVSVAAAVAATSISFNPTTVSLNVGGTYDAEETIVVTPSNASRIFLFESVDESIATVNEDTGLVTAVAVGTTTINAIAGYGDGYASLTVTVSASVTPTTGTIYFGNASGKTTVNSASVTGNDSLSNSWTVATAGTASYTQNADYSQIGSKNDPADSITFEMTMSSSVTFTAVSASFGGNSSSGGSVVIKIGTTKVAEGSVPSGSDVVIQNTNPISLTGTTITITITSISRAIKAYSILYSFTTGGSSSTVGVTGITLSQTSLSMTVGSVQALTATVLPAEATNKNVTWTSSSPSIATVNSGSVTAVAVGDTIITATTVDGGKTATCLVTVTSSSVAVTGISLSTNSLSLHIGDTYTLTATITPSNATDKKVSWTSSNTDVATVSNGTVTAVNAGSSTITAQTNDGGFAATCNVTVTASSATGDSTSFVGQYTYDNQGTTWTLSDCSDSNSYWLCPSSGTTSVALFAGIFTDRNIVSDVVVTIDHATYGSGTDPKETTFSLFTASDCYTSVTSTRTGSLATSKTYTSAIFTVSQSEANDKFTDDLAIQIVKPGKQIRLRSVKIEFEYEESVKVLESISVKTAPTKLEYIAGENFNPAGLVITRHYTDTTTKDLEYAGHEAEFGFSPSLSTALTTSHVSVTISWSDKSCSQAISVEPLVLLDSISVSGQTTTYWVGDAFSFNGTCTAHFDNNTSSTVTPTSVTTPDMSTSGQKTITVSYTYKGVSKSTTYTINVQAWVLSSIAITTNPTKTTYFTGEAFTSAGLVVTASYTNGKSKTVTPTSISSPNMSTAGQKTITVTYTENAISKTATFNIQVNAVTLESISVTSPTTIFHVGDSFSFGGTVTAHYNNGSSSNVTASATFTGYNMNSAGQQTVTVSYGGQTATYSINVLEQGAGNPVVDIVTPGTKTISLYTSTLTEGDYVIADGSYALKNTSSSSRIDSKSITVNNNVISSATDDIIWHIAPSGNYWTIYNNEAGKYAAATGTKNQGTLSSNGSDDESLWTVSGPTNNSFEFVNKNNSSNNVNAYLRFNSNNVNQFATYSTSTGSALKLYRVEETAGSSQQVTIESISAVSSKTTYHPGEIFDSSLLTVTGSYSGGTVNLSIEDCIISPANYMFTYEDARTGSKSIAVSWEGVTTSVTLTVTRVAYVPLSGETQSLTGSEFYSAGVTNGTGSNELQDFPNLVIGDIHYSADNVGIYTDTSTKKKYISFGKGIGELHNTTPFNKPLTSVSLQQMSGRRTDGVVYVSTDGTNWVSESSANFSSTNYYYFKIAYESASSASGAAGYSNFTIDYSLHGVETPTNVANYIMYEDTNNQCTSKFENAIIYFESLTAEGRTTFMTSNDYVISTARERFLAWAKHEGKTINYVNNDYVVSQSKSVLPILLNSKASQNAALITVITLVSFTALGGYFFLRKRKEQ